ncbi:alpha/beta fold hydrolase [Amycolatopsis sp. NPDC059021]|uniref:alpha/beta fold hydrolase n=1 Tax=Amycolatopsis sp. NPDC059021 TaxID=3346704 RepID=UPI00366AC731
MVLRKMVAIAGAALAALGLTVPAEAAQASPTWMPCTQLASSWPKTAGTSAECTTVTVPVDYARPDGRSLQLAVDRIPASDPAHRRGVLMLNPGGPGGTGMSMPELIRTSKLGELGKYYDLVSFDPRGTGFSGQVDCQGLGGEPRPQPGQSEKDYLATWITWHSDIYGGCAAKDPEFAAHLGVETIARDLDRVREALGERKIDYFGISWGTGLGAAYRSLFDDHVGRMAIDSVLPPNMDLDHFEADETKARNDNLLRFAGWMAERDAVLHLGTTGDQVYATELALSAELKAHPRTVVVNGQTLELNDTWVQNMASSLSPDWGYGASALAAVQAGKNPPARQPKAATTAGFGWDEKRPYTLNRFVQHGINCADTTGTRDLDQVWQEFSALRKQYPMSNADVPVYAGSCVQWPYAGKNFDYRPGRSDLQIIGHRYESVTPYAGAWEMRQRIGGSVLTVQDDVHGSLAGLPCASKVVRFFETGVPANDSCDGAPIPEPVPVP